MVRWSHPIWLKVTDTPNSARIREGLIFSGTDYNAGCRRPWIWGAGGGRFLFLILVITCGHSHIELIKYIMYLSPAFRFQFPRMRNGALGGARALCWGALSLHPPNQTKFLKIPLSTILLFATKRIHYYYFLHWSNDLWYCYIHTNLTRILI